MSDKQKDYYREISVAIRSYEEYKNWHDKTIEWICNRIDWCWKWRKITKEQMEELTDRIVDVMEKNKGE